MACPEVITQRSAAIRELRVRLIVGARLLILSATTLGAVGIIGHLAGASERGIGTVWLTATLGPTAYVLLAHPRSVSARSRNAILGHAAGIGTGLAALAVFGLWAAPSVAATGQETLSQVGAEALAVASTMLLLTLLDAHHAPAAATALLVASGIAAPGRALIGLVLGLILTVVLAAALGRLPLARALTAAEQGDDLASPSRPDPPSPGLHPEPRPGTHGRPGSAGDSSGAG